MASWGRGPQRKQRTRRARGKFPESLGHGIRGGTVEETGYLGSTAERPRSRGNAEKSREAQAGLGNGSGWLLGVEARRESRERGGRAGSFRRVLATVSVVERLRKLDTLVPP